MRDENVSGLSKTGYCISDMYAWQSSEFLLISENNTGILILIWPSVIILLYFLIYWSCLLWSIIFCMCCTLLEKALKQTRGGSYFHFNKWPVPISLHLLINWSCLLQEGTTYIYNLFYGKPPKKTRKTAYINSNVLEISNFTIYWFIYCYFLWDDIIVCTYHNFSL